MIQVEGKPDLVQIVATLSTISRFTNFLDGWYQESDKDGNDRNGHEQFH